MEYEMKYSKLTFKKVIFEILRKISIDIKYSFFIIAILFFINTLQVGYLLTNIYVGSNVKFLSLLNIIEKVSILNDFLNTSEFLLARYIVLMILYAKTVCVCLVLIYFAVLVLRDKFTESELNQQFFKTLIIYEWLFYIPEFLILIDDIKTNINQPILLFFDFLVKFPFINKLDCINSRLSFY